MDRRTGRQQLLLYVKGMAMGAADVVPGVSGGTVAFITGIYDQLIDSIRAFDLQALKMLCRGQWLQLWRHVDGSFLLVLMLGIATSILTMARLVSALLHDFPILIGAFFIGLILASSLYVARQISGWTAWRVGLMFGGMGLALFIGALQPTHISLDWPWVFGAGALAICAMILPGISGSFILLLLGMYTPVLTAIKELDLAFIAVFGTGCVCGLMAFVRLLSYLLREYHAAVLALLTGVLLGSLSIIWPWKQRLGVSSDAHDVVNMQNVLPWHYGDMATSQLLPAIVLLFVGVALVLGLEKIAQDQ